jgi:transposase
MRYELTDYEWTAKRPMLPNKPRGVPRVNDRRVLNGIFWVLRSGAPWRDLPAAFGPYTTCYNRFVRSTSGKPLSRPKSGSMPLADRGYDADWIRELAMKKGAWANIPPKSNRNDPICFSPYLYRARNRVERFFNRPSNVVGWRRAMTGSLPTTLPSIKLASIRLWLSLNESAS